MKKVKERLTAMLNAVTFAEAGDHEAAIELLDQSVEKGEVNAPSDATRTGAVGSHGTGLIRRVEDHWAAAAFAAWPWAPPTACGAA